MKFKFIVACVLSAFVFSFSMYIYGLAENALTDDSNAKTLIVEDKDTPNAIIKLKGNAASGAILVDGIGNSNCDYSSAEVVTARVANNAAGTITATATATQALISSRALGDMFWAPDAAITSTGTAMLLGPLEKIGIAATTIRNVYIYNESGGTATASVWFCP